jgi:hypothetical protein
MNAIVSVGAKWLYEYENGDVDFETRPHCILSNGEKFPYNKKELAKRLLFHTGKLDIPESRWDFNDLDKFSEDMFSKSFEEVYNLIREQFEKYMDFSDERLYTLFSCFVIYSYFYPLFNHAPVIQLWGEFKTGKTKVCSLLEAMMFNPINSANISSSSVFRLIESRRAIIILDESEDLLTAERARDIRNMLLAGTGKSGETFRQERSGETDNFHTQSFKVFSPKLIANIAGINVPALQSRTIMITMTGTNDKEKADAVVVQEDPIWKEIRNELYRLCLCGFQEVINIREKFPKIALSGRSLGLWQGILSIASLIDDNTFQELLSYAKENKENMEGDQEEFGDEPKAMLQKLLELCPDNKMVEKTPSELMDHFLVGLGYQFNITSKRDLATRLGRFGMHTNVVYYEGTHMRVYRLFKNRLEDLISKYK